MIEPDVAGAGALNGMSEVVDPARIGISPLTRDADRSLVVLPELAAELRPSLFLERDAPGMLDHQQLERVDERAEDIGALVIIL